MHPIRNKIADFIRLNGFFTDNRRLLVAFSGGADSVVLLDFCSRNAAKLGLVSVRAAHYNHRLRGEESDADQRFCEQFCAARAIPLTVSGGDVAGYAQKHGLSVELAARELRYAFLQDCASADGALIATAHHADDNLETMLLHLVRGCGLTGMGGIPVRRENIIRPLLCCTKEELLQYCTQNELSFVTDSSNLDDAYARNFLRNRVVPLLKTLNPALSRTAMHEAALFTEADNWLSENAETLLNKSARSGFLGEPVYDLGTLCQSSPAVLAYAVRLLSERHGLTASFDETDQICALITQKNGHRVIRGLRFDCCGEQLSVGRQLPKPEPVPLPLGTTVWGQWRITLTKSAEFPENSSPLFISSLNYVNIKNNLVIRSRTEGDEIVLENRTGTRTVKKLLNEYAVPVRLRDQVPIICDAAGIVAVGGIGAAKRLSPCPNGSTVQILIEPAKPSSSHDDLKERVANDEK